MTLNRAKRRRGLRDEIPQAGVWGCNPQRSLIPASRRLQHPAQRRSGSGSGGREAGVLRFKESVVHIPRGHIRHAAFDVDHAGVGAVLQHHGLLAMGVAGFCLRERCVVIDGDQVAGAACRDRQGDGIAGLGRGGTGLLRLGRDVLDQRRRSRRCCVAKYGGCV